MNEKNVNNIEICQNVEPHKDEELVKSKAVVKFSVVHFPVKFNQLECNTDIKLPPSNWLSTSANTYGLHKALYHTTGFASFRMAHMFADCLGDVDVVSDAENIKRLLKLPYSPGSAVSMMVHKVGNTLLIDEFDIQKYLLRNTDDDWKWLRTFILEHILSSSFKGKDRGFCLKDKSREAINTKNLLSKFLYYSLQSSEVEHPSNDKIEHKGAKPLPILGPKLPEPKIDDNVPDPKSSHVFHRNVVWTFEDIRMLIGTDMQIFGGPNRPCISLRLRDMSKPINVLTGIDYWLDNLMCNVPEVVMCYHLDGIVQKYELIKTEDLPYLENSQFSPQVVRNVAQNILSFLKANATKAGHTYWLFKGKNDDVVKLYDLSTLCKNDETSGDSKVENPFTVPVAMLLYTVARNMKNTSDKISAKKAGSIQALLDNCLKLLPKEKYPEIVTSSHYILSDLHIPTGIDPKSPRFDISDLDSDTQSVYDEDNDFDYGFNDYMGASLADENSFDEERNENIAVKSICDTLKDLNIDDNITKHSKEPLPLIASTAERCRIALEHISDGINCLQYFNSNEEKFLNESKQRAKEEKREEIIREELYPNMAKPSQPIPLPYESLKPTPKMAQPEVAIPMGWTEKITSTKSSKKKNKSNQQQGKTNQSLPTPNPSTCENNLIANKMNSTPVRSWNAHLKRLLIEKAFLTYATQGELNYSYKNYGESLKCIYMSIKCHHVVSKCMGTVPTQNCFLFGRAGDCFYSMYKNWNEIKSYLEQYRSLSHMDLNILGEIEKDIDNEIDLITVDPNDNVEDLMIACCGLYEAALEHANPLERNDILRRLGNVRNELGLKYMFWAQDEYNKFMENFSEDTDEDLSQERNYEVLAKKSYQCLLNGITIFEEVCDKVNLASLFSNMARFMRLRAHIHLKGEKPNDMKKMKRFYDEAFSNYTKAKSALISRKHNPELWDSVNWDLSTATFTLAQHVQDSGTKQDNCIEDLEKEALDLLHRSLSLCNVQETGPRQCLYTFRQGMIHKRIASLHHAQIRARINIPSLVKKNIQLCRLHYEKALNIFDSLKEPNEYLILQLERIALQEFLAESTTNVSLQTNNFKGSLSLCIESKPMLDYIGNKDNDITICPELLQHIIFFENRLQYTLKNLIRLTLAGKEKEKEDSNRTACFKQMYFLTLTSCRVIDEVHYAQHLSKVLSKIIEIYKN